MASSEQAPEIPATMSCVEQRAVGAVVVGRAAELTVLARVLEETGPRVCFVYGVAGIGKSSMLAAFGELCEQRGIPVQLVNCRSIDPTEQGFLDALSSLSEVHEVTVLLIDTYELFRIADPWLRHDLLPALGSHVRVVVAGREPPMLEWAVERGQIGGLEVLPLGPLGADGVAMMLKAVGMDDEGEASQITRLCRGHPLALRLAVETRLAGGELPAAQSVPRVVQALAGLFRDGLDERLRRALDAAAVPRRITTGLLTAMLGYPADEELDQLGNLAFTEPTSDGLRLHDAVQHAVVERLRAVDPERFRRYRTAAWHHLQTQTHSIAQHELARSTADLLFLIDNPVVREAMFPTTAHAFSVTPNRGDEGEELRSFWHEYDAPDAAEVLDRWLERCPTSVRVIRDRSSTLVGCSIVATWRNIPMSLEHDDPVTAGWARHAARHPLPTGQTTVVLRRVLAAGVGEGPSDVQAAAWLDVKRDYFSMRPHLGRVYTTLANPAPFLDALTVLGFQTFDPAMIGVTAFHLAALDFGPASVDGWLARLAAAELGITELPFMDATDRSVAVANGRIELSPLEFGLLHALHSRHGRPVTRAQLLDEVWGPSYRGGSNVVDVVVRNVRIRLGSDGKRLETVRGVGYRFT